MFFAVHLKRGGPWDWSRDLREQDGWEEHARFMDSLVNEGFVVLGGPLEGGREILHAISASSKQAQAGRQGCREQGGRRSAQPRHEIAVRR